ncbi:MAG: hypothetical protein U5L45_10050 [Saprospiraceae bacterium]|nr:hypothetical protein [Saprospiraceae bacterium]
MWFVFRLRRKTNHVFSLLRERSARKTSVFNQKTMFLGYAHSSVTYFQYLSLLSHALALLARVSRKVGKVYSNLKFDTLFISRSLENF